MADRKAINKFIPPDFDPAKHGSVNAYHNSHPLRARAKNIAQGILTIRFEMPYNSWCLSCQKHIGMGVRYNAQKQKVGAYFSTPIWEFRFKCHLCQSQMAMRTDPQNTAYVCVEGIRKAVTDYEPGTEQIQLQTAEEKEKLLEDPFYKLEHDQKDLQQKQDDEPRLLELEDLRRRQFADPYKVSQTLRASFRAEKVARKAVEKECQSLADKNSLSIAVLPLIDEDIQQSQQVDFKLNQASTNALKKDAELQTHLFEPAERPKNLNAAVKSEVKRQKRLSEVLDKSATNRIRKSILKKKKVLVEDPVNVE